MQLSYADQALGYDSLEVVLNYRDELDVRLLNKKEVIEQVSRDR